MPQKCRFLFRDYVLYVCSMSAAVLKSSTLHRETTVAAAPAAKQLRAMPTTPSALISPRAVLQALMNTVAPFPSCTHCCFAALHLFHLQAGQRRPMLCNQQAFYNGLKPESKVGLAAAKTAAMWINLNIDGCGVVAPPVHSSSRAPLLLANLLAHNLPLPRAAQ